MIDFHHKKFNKEIYLVYYILTIISVLILECIKVSCFKFIINKY